MWVELPLFQIDAFACEAFRGNPAAVCPLGEWLPDAVMQAIAAENNLSETAFFVAEPAGAGTDFHIRWFTPMVEMDLCGHATLASADVVFRHLGHGSDTVRFRARAGTLALTRRGEELVMNFPANPPAPVEPPAGLSGALGATPAEVLNADYMMAVFDSEPAVRALRPDFARLATIDVPAVIATAPGTGVADFVSRFFAPNLGVDEDPVTGSAHCVLIPYWADRLGRDELTAHQVSARGGELACSMRRDADPPRVEMAGRAVEYLRGTITV